MTPLKRAWPGRLRRAGRASAYALALLTGLAAAPGSSFAGDAAAGRSKALKCKQCHGIDGLGKLPTIPNLAGQSEVYLAKSLRDFRDGLRQDQMMTFMVENLSDDDIDDLAAYFSSIEIEIKLPD